MSSSKSYVVYDWNYFRGLPNDYVLANDHRIVLADTVFHEIAHSDNPNAFITKLLSILQASNASDKIFIGHYWNDLSMIEANPFKSAGIDSLFHNELTIQFRDYVRSNPVDMTNRIQNTTDSLESNEYESQRAEFVALCEQFTKWANETQGSQIHSFRSNPTKQRLWIQQPNQVTDYIARMNPDRFASDDWRQALSVFPDIHAIGRWARIVLWYVMRRLVEDNAQDFENNWDDAHYAFLTSYTKCLATHDSGLKKLVTNLYAGVEFYEP